MNWISLLGLEAFILRWRAAALKPGPVSETVSTAERASTSSRISSWPPGGVCWIALCTRLRVSSRNAQAWLRTGAGALISSKSSCCLRSPRMPCIVSPARLP